MAELYAKQRPGIWGLAGVGPKAMKDVDEEEGKRYSNGSVGNGNGVVGSASS